MKNNLGKISKHDDGFRVRFERLLPFDIETVWSAITAPEKLAIWFTDIEIDFTEGGKIMIQFRDAEKTKSFGNIVRIIKPKIFEFTWEGELATWELFEEKNKTCRLVLTYSKLPDEYASHVPAGWHILLDRLETILNGRKAPYSFGGEATPEDEKMKAVYAEILKNQFPLLK